MLRFYAGKGGVGKTTCAAAAALALSRQGARTLVVSTDPAHSLADALQSRLSARPLKVARNLFAAEMNADRALDRWLRARERSFREIAARGTYLDDEDIDALFRLSLPGVDELVALIELRRLAEGFDEVVVDTAPTGHTLRLLQTPRTLAGLAEVLDDLQAKHRAIAASLRGTLRRDAEDRVIDQLRNEAHALDAWLRSTDAGFHWVTLLEELPAAETRDGIAALRGAGVHVVRLIANRATPAPDRSCPLCAGRRAGQARVFRSLRNLALPVHLVPEQEIEPTGLRALARIGEALEAPPAKLRDLKARPPRPPADRGGEDRIAELAPPGTRLLFFGGKGGVGKTTAAATAALALAKRGELVLLLSTDPAHSLGDALALGVSDDERDVAPNLKVRELDANRGFAHRRQRYRAAVDELFATLRGGASFDAPYDRAVIHDLIDLAPPGLDELFGLLGVIEALRRHDLVVVDTAPTGHALRLLELVAKAREWVRVLLQILLKYRAVVGLGDLARDLTATARELREFQELLRDGARCRFVAVTRAAALPRQETRRLLSALGRLDVNAAAVLVNALTPPGCTRCTRVAAAEASEIARMRRGHGDWAMLGAPLLAQAPRGSRALSAFGRTWARME